jgi:hypothetical protein
LKGQRLNSKESEEAREKGADDLRPVSGRNDGEFHNEPPFKSYSLTTSLSRQLKQKIPSPSRDEEILRGTTLIVVT